MSGFAAVILAGGAGRRMGMATAKPATPVAGRPMIFRVLDAVSDAAPRIVVGPPTLELPAGVVRVWEDPPGGGPVAAIVTGLAELARCASAAVSPDVVPPDVVPPGVVSPGVGPTDAAVRCEAVALLAADLPLLTRAAVSRLLAALAGSPAHDGAVFVDQDGRRQFLCGVWRVAALQARAAAMPSTAGMPMRAFLDGLRVDEVSAGVTEPPPWYDCDAPADVRRAERWM